jgi:hypothetical protein
MFNVQAARWLVVFLVLAGAVRATADDSPGALPAPHNASSSNSEQDAAVHKALDQRVDVGFDEITLKDLSNYLRDRGIDLVLDERALEEAGMGDDSTLHPLNLKQVTLRSALQHLIGQAELALLVRDGKLLVTTTDRASNELITKIYRVDDLVRVKDSDDTLVNNYDPLVDLVETVVMPDSWDAVGGPGTIRGFQGTLVISQTDGVHEEIERTLAALRSSRAAQLAGAPPEPHWADTPAQDALRRDFAERSKKIESFEFDEVPLADALRAIGEKFGVQFVLRNRSLEEAGVGSDTPVTAALRQVNLPAALRRILAPMELTYLLQDEAVVVTTTDQASNELTTVVYPVGDLIGYPAAVAGTDGATPSAFDSLIGVLTTTIKPSTWNDVGGPGTVAVSGVTASIALSQTPEVHGESQRLLAGLRQVRTPNQQQAVNGLSGEAGLLITRRYTIAPEIDQGELERELVRIDPLSWNRSGARIQFVNSQLVVRNSRSVQRAVHRHLSQSGALGRPAGGLSGGGMGGMGGGMMGGAAGGMGGMGGGMGGGIGVPGGKH